MFSLIELSQKDSTIIKDCAMALVFVIGLIFFEHAHAQSGNVYRNSGAQVAQTVKRGTVIGVRGVAVEPRDAGKGVGSVVGATLGGLLGAKLAENGNTYAQSGAALIGAALGGLGGNLAAEKAGQNDAIEILVHLVGRNGDDQVLAVVQPLPGPDVSIGQEVLVLNDRGQNRVIPSQLPRQAPAAAPERPMDSPSGLLRQQRSRYDLVTAADALW